MERGAKTEARRHERRGMASPGCHPWDVEGMLRAIWWRKRNVEVSGVQVRDVVLKGKLCISLYILAEHIHPY